MKEPGLQEYWFSDIIEREQQIYNSDIMTGSTVRKLSPPWGSEICIKWQHIKYALKNNMHWQPAPV